MREHNQANRPERGRGMKVSKLLLNCYYDGADLYGAIQWVKRCYGVTPKARDIKESIRIWNMSNPKKALL